MQRRMVIGTSGYSYKHWKNAFYPDSVKPKDYLAFYSSRFDSVELNVAFYRLVPRTTFAGWHARTPRDFSFVIKGPRFITHVSNPIARLHMRLIHNSNAAPDVLKNSEKTCLFLF